MGLYEDIPAFVLFGLTTLGAIGLVLFTSRTLSGTGLAVGSSAVNSTAVSAASAVFSYYPYVILAGMLGLVWLFGYFTYKN